VHEPLKISFRNPRSAVPKPPAEAFRGALEEEHRIAYKPLCLDQSLNGRLDMPYTHGYVPPIKDMLHLSVAIDGIADEVRECRLAIRDHRQKTTWPPSKG